jgi:tellurite resistance protein TerA
VVDYTKRPAPAATAPATAAVSLSKVTLTKASPSVSLTKGAGASGQLRVNLSWSPGAPAKGLFKRGGGQVDLDLACLYELADGRKGVVQALGNAFGSLDRAPWILLDGDDRSGSYDGGENLLFNLSHLDQIRRVLVFAFIYEGVPAWDRADGVVTIFPQGAAPIEIRLDESSPARTCALAMLENDGHGLAIKREVRYVDGSQSALDRAYGWGMDWTPGRK